LSRAEILSMTVGYGAPLLAAPIAMVALRPLFSIFTIEGVALFGDTRLDRGDVRDLAATMAIFNVGALTLAWLGIHSCQCFLDDSTWIKMACALAGVIVAVLALGWLVRTGLDYRGSTRWLIALLAFAGGNLPVIVVTGALAVLL